MVALGLLGCGEPAPPPPPPQPVDWRAAEGVARRIAADGACARGEVEACWWLGMERRWSDPPDPLGAWAAWSRACDADHPVACEAAAVEAPTPALARAQYARGCTLGNRSACLGATRLDPGCAPEACAEACERGAARACTHLGRSSTGPEADALLWKGCDLDDPWGCLILADRVAAGADNPSGKSLEWLYTQVCDIQLDYGCVGHRLPEIR